MTAQEFLNKKKSINKIIKSDMEEIETLNSLATKVTASLGTVVAGTKEHDKIGKITEQIDEYRRKIIKEVLTLIEVRKDIFAAIQNVEDADEQQILRLRYINGRTFEKIAREMKKDERQIYRIHNEALGHVVVPEKYTKRQ